MQPNPVFSRESQMHTEEYPETLKPVEIIFICDEILGNWLIVQVIENADIKSLE